MLADQEASTSASLTRHAPALVAPADVGRLEAELGDKKVTHAPLFQVFAGRPASLSTAQLLLPIFLAACVRGLRGLGGREGRCVGVWDVCILRVDPRRENLTVGIRRRARPLLASPLAGLRCRRASVRSLRPTRKSSAISWHVSRWCKLSLSPRAFSRPLPLAPPPLFTLFARVCDETSPQLMNRLCLCFHLRVRARVPPGRKCWRRSSTNKIIRRHLVPSSLPPSFPAASACLWHVPSHDPTSSSAIHPFPRTLQPCARESPLRHTRRVLLSCQRR